MVFSKSMIVNVLIDTQREKLCFIQFSTRMASWLLLTFLICLHNQLSSILQSITVSRINSIDA